MKCHKANCEFLYYYNKTDLKPPYLMVDFRSFWITGPVIEKLCAHTIITFQ